MVIVLRRQLPIKKVILLGICIIALLLGGIAWHVVTRPQPHAAAPQPTTQYLESVSEEPLPANYVWHGPKDEPKYIKLPSIATEGFVQTVGLSKNQEIQVPSNIHTVGWFNQSAKPGQPGLSVIDGHVDGTTKPGIFRRLGELKPADQFTVELGGGDTKTYKVIATKMVENAQALSVLFSQQLHVQSQLNLITCGGTFSKQSKTYDHRIIVSAELVS